MGVPSIARSSPTYICLWKMGGQTRTCEDRLWALHTAWEVM